MTTTGSHTRTSGSKQKPVERASAEHPCPTCTGHGGLTPGTGTRCTSYTEDGWKTWVCTREQWAGTLTPVQTATGLGWPHRADKCPCRIQHGVLPPTPTDDADDEPEGCTRAAYAAHGGFDSLELGRLDMDNCGCVDSKLGGLKTTAFPWLRADGAVVWHHRLSLHHEPRFKWGRGAKLAELEPFGIQTLPRAKELGSVILPEAESDAQRLILEGFAVLASPGKDTWQPTWNRHLEGLTPYVVDEGGDGAAHVRTVGKDLAVRARMRTLDFSPWNVKDPNALAQLDPAQFRERMQQAMADAKTWEAWSAEQRESAPDPWNTLAALREREITMKERLQQYPQWRELVAREEDSAIRDSLINAGADVFQMRAVVIRGQIEKIRDGGGADAALLQTIGGRTHPVHPALHIDDHGVVVGLTTRDGKYQMVTSKPEVFESAQLVTYDEETNKVYRPALTCLPKTSPHDSGHSTGTGC